MVADFSHVERTSKVLNVCSEARIAGNGEMMEEDTYAPTITELYQQRIAALSRYDETERADRDAPYRDSRRSSRETDRAFWEAIRAITAYKVALDTYHRQRAYWIAVYILTVWEESKRAA